MSNLFTLNWKDFLNGLIMAVVGNVVFYLMIIFGDLYALVMQKQPFHISIDWTAVWVIAVFSFLSYLVKRFFSGSTGTILVK